MKKMTKKLLAMLLVIAMLFSISSVGYATNEEAWVILHIEKGGYVSNLEFTLNVMTTSVKIYTIEDTVISDGEIIEIPVGDIYSGFSLALLENFGTISATGGENITFSYDFANAAIGESEPTIQIPDDAVEFNGHYYKAYDITMTWEAAKVQCEYLGGHLATITSQDENAFLLSIAPKAYYFIGATDIENEGEWQWITGEEWVYTNWSISEPNNGKGGAAQNYSAMYGQSHYRNSRGRWDDSWNDPGGECGFICEWESEEAIDIYAGPGSSYYHLGEDIISDYIPISVENGYCEIEHRDGNYRAYVAVTAIEDIEEYDVSFIKNSNESFGVNKPNTIIKMVNQKFITTTEIRTSCGPGKNYIMRDLLPVGTEVALLYNENDYYCVEYQIDGNSKRGYIDKDLIVKGVSENIADKEFDSVKTENACFLYKGKNVYSAYSASGNEYFNDAAWNSIASFSVMLGGWDIWKGIVAAIAGNDVDTSEMEKLSPQTTPNRENVANNINAIADGLQMIFVGINAADQRTKVNCHIEENRGKQRLILTYGNPIEYFVQGQSYSLGSLLFKSGNYLTKEDDVIRKWFPGYVEDTGTYSMWLNFSENASHGNGYSLVVKNDGCLYAYPIFREGTSFPVYHTVNGKTTFAFDAVDIYKRVATKIDETTTKQLLEELRNKGLESSFIKTTVKCPTDIEVINSDDNSTIIKTKNGKTEINVDNNNVTIDTIDNAKIIRYTYDSNIDILTSSFGYGTMTYSVEQMENAKIVKNVVFNDIEIIDGSEFTGCYSGQAYTLSGDNYSESKEFGNYSRDVEIIVKEISGGFVKGIPINPYKDQLVSLCAINYEGYRFVGWYKNDEFFSENDELVFVLNESVSLEARFEPVSGFCEEGHSEYTVMGYSAQCNEKGLTDGSICVVCNAILKEQSVIPATEHVFNGSQCKNCGYVHTCIDNSHDGICDACAEDFTKGCSCNCHGNAFMQFLHKIVSFLRKIFGMEQYHYCNCGKAHW